MLRKLIQDDKSFASSVLDKAVMDNLDLTFTESLVKDDRPSKGTHSRFKKSVNDSLFNDEFTKQLNSALQTIPENFELSVMEQNKKHIPPKPLGILKNTRRSAVPKYDQPTQAPINLDSIKSLRDRLNEIRKNSSTVESKHTDRGTPQDLNAKIKSLIVPKMIFRPWCNIVLYRRWSRKKLRTRSDKRKRLKSTL